VGRVVNDRAVSFALTTATNASRAVRCMLIGARCGTSRSEPYHLRGQQFAAINFAFEQARNAAMRMDFQTTRQTLIAKVCPIWCYEECVPHSLVRHFSSAT
jgi:hypothetical protein